MDREGERNEEKVARYINGLRYDIKDEISMATVKKIYYGYQIALKLEEKLTRKQSQQNIVQNLNRGKGVAWDKEQKPKDEVEKPHSHAEKGESS